MAAIPQSKSKYAPPDGKTPEWLIQEIYKDVKEIKEEWCPRISRTEWIVGILSGVLAVVGFTVFMIHPQDIADGLAGFFGIN